jgi:hypothetical protein
MLRESIPMEEPQASLVDRAAMQQRRRPATRSGHRAAQAPPTRPFLYASGTFPLRMSSRWATRVAPRQFVGHAARVSPVISRWRRIASEQATGLLRLVC